MNIEQKYKENYSKIAEMDLELSMQPEWFLQIQAERIFSRLKLPSGSDYCDLGVGQGVLAGMVLDRTDAKVTGIDICEEYLEGLKKKDRDGRLDVLIRNAESLGITGAFDVITSTDVMEHVLNVGDYLQSVYDALRPGGRFFVRVPYLEDYSVYARSRGCEFEFVHLRNFSRESLLVVLKGAGFNCRRVWYDGFIAGRLRFPLSYRNGWVKRLKFEERLANLPSVLGRIVCKPVVITVLCEKPMD